ncbi:preprotein translocase subunit SecY [Candidatus Saccharibacteria bacterium]|nr:preprotein translocase subunit SecY [Candidatus Saccharibacteria bacterium]
MLKRVLALIGLIIIYRLLAHVPIPLTDPITMQEALRGVIQSTDLGGFMDLISGGSLTQFSIIMVGLGPYITASIIVQLMSKALPQLEEMQKDGETGRRKLAQWTRMLTVPLAIVQSIAFMFILQRTVLAANVPTFVEASTQDWVMAVTATTAGSILLMWIGEMITEQGIGNGISTIIFASIISTLPATLATLWAILIDPAGGMSVFGWFTIPVNGFALLLTLGLVWIALLSLYILVKINEAQRIVVINYAKRVRGNSVYGGVRSILPIKLISAGVIPVIFSLAFLSLPAFLGQLLRSADRAPDLANNLITWFSSPTTEAYAAGSSWLIYPAFFFLLVVAFTYFYSSIIFTPSEIAENIQKQGGFIDGVRPGKQTADFLGSIVRRLNLFGALTLGLIAILPFVLDYLMFALLGNTIPNLSMNGTGLLIAVTVALESLRQLNSRALMTSYDDYTGEDVNLEAKGHGKTKRSKATS